MNLLAIIVIFLAIAAAGAIAYIAWEISSDKPRVGTAEEGRDVSPRKSDAPER